MRKIIFRASSNMFLILACVSCGESRLGTLSSRESPAAITFDSSAALKVSSADQRSLTVLYVIIGFKDNPNTINSNVLFAGATEASHWLLESSSGQMSLLPSIVHVELDLPSVGRCDANAWSKLANANLLNTEHSPDKFDLRSYVFTIDNTICGGGGVAGGRESHIFSHSEWNYVGFAHTLFHEHGHNFGFGHTGSVLCESQDFSNLTKCRNDEYGDFYDIMGRGAIGRRHSPMYLYFSKWLRASEIEWLVPGTTVELNLAPLGEISSRKKVAFYVDQSIVPYRIFAVFFRSKIGQVDYGLDQTTGAFIQVDESGTFAHPKTLLVNPDPYHPFLKVGQRIDFVGIPFSVEQIDLAQSNLKLKIQVD